MRHWTLRAVVLVVVGGWLLLDSAPLTAHKPITSRYTYNAGAFPIFRARCSGCHVVGGIAPMSLMTHADAVPWAESIRAELLAGHMPPSQVDGPPGRFRNLDVLTPNELDVLLTWASGGTPAGDTNQPPEIRTERRWKLGTPNLRLQLPSVTVTETQVEDLREFRLPLGNTQDRWIRALDLMPGTPSLVRSATIAALTLSSDGQTREQLLALWQPGEEPIPFETGLGFHVPPSATLIARVRYKKPWRDHSRAISDTSSIGIYFAAAVSREVDSLILAADTPVSGRESETESLTFVDVVDRDLKALAIYPDPELHGVRVKVVLVTPDGVREPLVVFRPRSQWARRYWFSAPVALTRGTRIEVTARIDDTLLTPESPRIPVARLNPRTIRLVMDVFLPAGS
jgi:hypothetical protein